MLKEKPDIQPTSIQDKLSHIMFLFLSFCMTGWVYEVALGFLYGHGFINRGFLFGPYLPVYGFGILILMACLGKLMARPIKIGRISFTPLIVFSAIVIITTMIEYMTGYFMELLFHQRFWNYSDYPFNLHGRICLSASLRFGVGGMIFLYLLIPLFSKWIKKIPNRLRHWLALAIVVLLAADVLLTLYFSSQNGFNPMLGETAI